jgi:hypothetical protein
MEEADCPLCGEPMFFVEGKTWNRYHFTCRGSDAHVHRVTIYVEDSKRKPKRVSSKPPEQASVMAGLLERAKRLMGNGGERA